MRLEAVVLHFFCALGWTAAGPGPSNLKWSGEALKFRGGAVYFTNEAASMSLICESSPFDDSLVLEITDGAGKATRDPLPTSQYFHRGIVYRTNNLQPGKYRCRSVKNKEWSSIELDVYRLDENLVESTGKIKLEVLEVTREIFCRSSTDLNPGGEAPRISWRHDNSPLSEVPGEKFEIFQNGTLRFKQVSNTSSGVFLCEFHLPGGRTASNLVEVDGAAFVQEKSRQSRNVMEGDDVNIDCEVFGYPVPDVTWMKDGKPLGNESQRILLGESHGVRNATLKILASHDDDGGEYTCVATNAYGTSNATVTLGVKDKLAALWPFLGIVAEVAILVAVIFIYERRKAKREMEEAVDPEQKKSLTAEAENELRQRKS